MWPKVFFSGARAGIAALMLAVSMPGAPAAGPAQVALDTSIRPVGAAPATGPVDPRRPFISRAVLKPDESAAMMSFEVALKMRNFAQLRARVDKGERISSQEMAAKYEPLATDYQAVVDWLTSKGLTVTRGDGHHMAIFARGTVGQIEQATQVKFARVTLHGNEYTSAVTAPSVPGSIASLLVGINGLQPHLHAHKHTVKPNAGSGSAFYTPSQLAQAYQASGLYGTNITGAGQAIAIVIDTFPAKSDLIAFWNGYGINQSINNISFIQAVAGTLPAPSGEETLDTEWSSSIAPGAKVRVYACADANLSNASLDATYQKVYEDASNHPELEIHQMSMSYGLGEIESTDAQMQTDDQYFVELTNAGVTCFASSGDGGSVPETDANGIPELEPESPASDPNVIGVGGTTLTLNSNNTESTEVVWNGGESGGASGGGTSRYFTHSTCPWQTQNGVAIGTMREVPDISCAADPNYGADYYFTIPDSGGEVDTAIGGTSWASPTCAGFCALINQARANVGLAAIGELGPDIYPQIGTANFRDITSGNNALSGSGTTNGIPNYTANANGSYNEATGIGVPLVLTLAETLANTQTLVGVGQLSTLQTVNQGQNATITVTASGSPVSYQWQRMPIGVTTWSNLSDTGVYSGSATASLTVTNTTTAMSGDQFQCVVTYTGTGPITSAQPTVLMVENPVSVTTLAGTAGTSGLTTNVTGTAAQFNYPTGIAIDSSGNLYIADLQNNEIREVTPAGAVTTPYGSLTGAAGSTNGSGNSGTAPYALFNSPRDITIDGSNNLYVSDEGNNLIRKIDTSTGQVTTIGTSANPAFNEPKGIAVDGSGNVYVADSGNNVIRKIAALNGAVTVVAGSSTFAAGYANGAATTQALFNEPIGLAMDHSGNFFVTEYNNEVVREISSGGVVSTVAGQPGVAGCLDGTGSQALFNVPRGILVDSNDNLYVTDSYAPVNPPPPELAGNNLLRKITPAGVVTTLAGQAGIAGSEDGTGCTVEFYNPCGMALNTSGELYVADASNNTIRTAVVEPLVSVSATQPYASVNGFVAGQFTVTRTGSTLASLTVDYSLAGSTAVSPTDYTALPGSVTIPAGASSATIAVNPVSNPQTTANLTVQLTLTSSIAGVLIDSNPATVTISEAKPTMFSPWEASFPNPLSGASAGMSATPWNDGISNLLKYVFDIDPSVPMTAADRAALPTPGATTIGETNYLTLTYREYAGLTGVAVDVQTSPDLRTWTTLTLTTTTPTATTYALQQVDIDPNTGDPILQVQVPATGTSKFIRLNVTSP